MWSYMMSSYNDVIIQWCHHTMMSSYNNVIIQCHHTMMSYPSPQGQRLETILVLELEFWRIKRQLCHRKIKIKRQIHSSLDLFCVSIFSVTNHYQYAKGLTRFHKLVSPQFLSEENTFKKQLIINNIKKWLECTRNDKI